MQSAVMKHESNKTKQTNMNQTLVMPDARKRDEPSRGTSEGSSALFNRPHPASAMSEHFGKTKESCERKVGPRIGPAQKPIDRKRGYKIER